MTCILPLKRANSQHAPSDTLQQLVLLVRPTWPTSASVLTLQTTSFSGHHGQRPDTHDPSFSLKPQLKPFQNCIQFRPQTPLHLDHGTTLRPSRLENSWNFVATNGLVPPSATFLSPSTFSMISRPLRVSSCIQRMRTER